MNNDILKLGSWLSTFTYENLTKKKSKTPRESNLVISQQQEYGTGGTCFSLVNLAVKKAQEKKLEPRRYLGDRPDGEARHCVIGFPREGVFFDPGYLCFNPLPLHPPSDQKYVRPHNVLHLKPVDENHLKVCTSRKGQLTWRYTLQTDPVDQNVFREAWKESFGWESVMNSQVLTRLREHDMIMYLNGRLESITRENRERLEIPDNHSNNQFIADLFGLDTDYLDGWDLQIQE